MLPYPALEQAWADAQLLYHTSKPENIQAFLPKIMHKCVPRQSNPKLQAYEIRVKQIIQLNVKIKLVSEVHKHRSKASN